MTPNNLTLAARMTLSVAPASDFADEVAALEAQCGRMQAALGNLARRVRTGETIVMFPGMLSEVEATLSATPASDTPRKVITEEDKPSMMKLAVEVAGSEDWWDQNSVQCGNCSVEIVPRKGSIPNNNGLSDPQGSEDEHLCGRCAGVQMYIYSDQLADAEARIGAAVEALKTYARCCCYWREIEKCPSCGGPISLVRNETTSLNDDQFDSIKAGDYYCESCTSAQARRGFKYWWRSELKRERHECGRCAALANLAAAAAQQHDARVRRDALEDAAKIADIYYAPAAREIRSLIEEEKGQAT